MRSLWRVLQVSRLREIASSAGQYAVGFLMAGRLDLVALVGLVGAVSAGLFAFNYNTLMDHQRGQTVEGPGKNLGRLEDHDLRVARVLCVVGLVVALVVVLTLVAVTTRIVAGVCLVSYIAVGFLYSSPSYYWKARPGLECVSNGLAHVLPFLAGYLQFAAPDRIAVCYSVAFFLFMSAYYLMHCLEDTKADARAGIRNLCSVLGFKRTVCLAIILTGVAGLAFLWAALELRVLLLFLPFFAFATVLELCLLRSHNLDAVGWVRRLGRLYGLVLTGVLLVRAMSVRGPGPLM
jgi:4-hydroxybenzoate polyprenyltransferase